MGRVIAGAALSIYSYTEPVETDKVRYGQLNVPVEPNKGTPEELEEAKALMKFHDEDYEGFKEARLKDKNMMPIGVAGRIIRLEHEPDLVDLYLTCVSFGDIAFSGLPGEPFTEIGRQIKARSPFKMTIPCCCANGYQGYFPTYDAFAEGGYEAGSARFKAGIAETLIEKSVELVNAVNNK